METISPGRLKTTYLFNQSFASLLKLLPEGKVVIVTDDHVYKAQQEKFSNIPVITVPSGEATKQQKTVDDIIAALLKLQADKSTVIVAVGGGVVTDMAGYAASIYKRGVRLALAPTSILAMVDAAVGGKNGVDVGLYKNMVGTVYQPEYILFDYHFLSTLPQEEWVNGFAEIIKHACIKDAALFEELSNTSLSFYQHDPARLASLVERNVRIKKVIVEEDEFETGDRKLLNFGHTVGHAIENVHHLPHGHAISVGMVIAATLSEELAGLPMGDTRRLITLLNAYGLTTAVKFNLDTIWEILLMDKKRANDSMNFILLRAIGDGIIMPIPLTQLKALITAYLERS
ncbi:MAG: 3-dehydroquinate synthase [Ferruginibacter sp.]|nr:3-dehydroquinate synthase [Ferruginibacter sp.]